MRRRDRQRDLRAQRPRLLGHQLRWRPLHHQLHVPVQPGRHRAQLGLLRALLPRPRNTIVGNTVYDNNNDEAPAIDVALLAQGNGILLAGSVKNQVERNLVFDHDRTGIAAVPFPEEDASDVGRPTSELDTPCEEIQDDEIPARGRRPRLRAVERHRQLHHRQRGVEGSGLADIASATIPARRRPPSPSRASTTASPTTPSPRRLPPTSRASRPVRATATAATSRRTASTCWS